MSDDRINPTALMEALRVVVGQAPRAEFVVRRYRKMLIGARRDTVVLRNVTELDELAARVRNIGARAQELIRDVTLWGVLEDECARLDLEAESREDARQHVRDVDDGTPPAA